MSIARAIVHELRDDPEALAELRKLVADTTPAGHLLRPEEAAERLGVSRRTVNRWATEGRIPAVKAGGGRGWRFPADRLVVAPPRRRTPEPPPPPRRPAAPRHGRSSVDSIAAIRGR